MFLIKSEDNFLLNQFMGLLFQNNIEVTHRSDVKHFACIDIKSFNSELVMKVDTIHLKYSTPIVFQKLLHDLISLLSDLSFGFGNLSYNPIKQLVIFNNKILSLKNFHNIILRNLILHEMDGLSKEIIYRKLWPNDKTIMINKLDTHLTNLKNFLKKEINFNLNFTSSLGQIKLIRD